MSADSLPRKRKGDIRLRLSQAGAAAVLCVWTAAGLGFSGCHSTPALTSQEAEGKHLYQVRCAHCHEANNLGLNKIPPNLHGALTVPTLPSGVPATDIEVKRVILAGKGTMPSFAGRFTGEQMEALLAYLHTGLR